MTSCCAASGPSVPAGTEVGVMDRGDLDFLTTAAGAELVARAASLDWRGSARVTSTATVRRLDPDHAAAVIDLVGARARARDRIRGADRMLLTDEAVQQALLKVFKPSLKPSIS